MRLAYHGANSIRSDLATDVKVAAQAGYRALELWAAKLDDYLRGHSLAETKALLTRSHVEPGPINSIEFIGFRGPEYEQIRNRCRELCSIAEGIGCSKVVLVPSPTPAPKEAGGDLFFPWESVVNEYVTVLRDLSAVAQPYGVGLAFEFLGFAWCSVRTPRAAYQIIREAGRENVGLTLDACHFYGGGGELREIDALDPTRIYSFHLDDMEDVPKEAIHDSRRLLPGSGVVPLDSICSHLKGINYNGFCSVELFRPEYWDWDPYELATRVRDAAVKVLSPYFRVE